MTPDSHRRTSALLLSLPSLSNQWSTASASSSHALSKRRERNMGSQSEYHPYDQLPPLSPASQYRHDGQYVSPHEQRFPRPSMLESDHSESGSRAMTLPSPRHSLSERVESPARLPYGQHTDVRDPEHSMPAPYGHSDTNASHRTSGSTTPRHASVSIPSGTTRPYPDHETYHGHGSRNAYQTSQQHPPSFSTPSYPPQSYHEPPYVYAGPPVVTAYPAGGSKKRANRASQACDQCRARKSKCDEGDPCRHCKSSDIKCTYAHCAAPSKSDKSTNTALAEVLGAIRGPMTSMENKLDLLSKRLEQFEQTAAAQRRKHRRGDSDGFSRSSQDNPTVQLGELPPETADITGFDNFDEHTTAAHKLIRFWPSVSSLLHGILPQADYIHDGEARGSLRLYGHGEDDEIADDDVKSTASSSGNASSKSSSNGASIVPTPMVDPRARSLSFPRINTTLQEEKLDLRPTTVRRLFDNYKHKLHIMHPFLDITALEDFMIYALDAGSDSDHSEPLSPFKSSNNYGEWNIIRSNKRKRSRTNSADCLYPGSLSPQSNSSMPERTLRHAILFLILALGQVIEKPYPDKSRNHAGQAVTTESVTEDVAHVDVLPDSPALGKARSVDDQPLPSHTVKERRSSNVESIPGLSYYREACVILGGYGDSNALGCAQARLLAGLYKGQLARVRESWSWIHDASRICRYHIVMQRLNKRPSATAAHATNTSQTRRENMLLVLAWSCLQLESDILAEFDYPHSGLAAYESDLPYPRLYNEDRVISEAQQDINRRIEHHYLGQLYLRKRLNEMHANLYGKSLAQQSSARLAEVLQENEFALENWKEISVKLKLSIECWTDDDEPASDILTARLRGKYYGARYIALRPFLDYSLHALEQIKTGKTLEELAVDIEGKPRMSELALFQAISTMSETLVQEKAALCVRSAMHSTVAFDKVLGRLTVTNIVGTSHAQFGNMLVLSATYNSGTKWLSDLVPATKLQELLERTVAFLEHLRHISPTARTDAAILIRIQRHLFPDTNRGERRRSVKRDVDIETILHPRDDISMVDGVDTPQTNEVQNIPA